MSFRILLMALFCTLPVTSVARVLRGGISDGGGNAVVCRENNKITSAELYDLFEARGKGLTFSKFDSTDYLEIANQIAKKVDNGGAGVVPFGLETKSSGGNVYESRMLISPPNYRKFIQDMVSHLDSTKLLLPPGMGLSAIDDFEDMIIPTNCALEQAARYDDSTDELTIVGDIWRELDPLNKAALLVHEALYKNLRTNGETSSDRTRRAIGYASTDIEFPFYFDGIPNDVLICYSTDDENPDEKPRFVFTVYSLSDKFDRFQFLRFDGAAVLSKTTWDISKKASPLSSPTNKDEVLMVFDKLSQTIVEKNKKMAWRLSNSKSGLTSYYIGLNQLVHSDKDLIPVLCNMAHWLVKPNGTTSW